MTDDHNVAAILEILVANLNVHKLNSPTRHGHVTASPSSQSCHCTILVAIVNNID